MAWPKGVQIVARQRDRKLDLCQGVLDCCSLLQEWKSLLHIMAGFA
jgi:hypothetical protein